MQGGKYITVLSNGKKLVLNANTILYVLMIERTAEIHVSGGKVYEMRMKIRKLWATDLSRSTGAAWCPPWPSTTSPTTSISTTANP